MNEITIEKLLESVKTYNKTGIELIKKAYDTAKSLHEGQLRQSGEPYISHPLNVAYILSEMHADTNTICAGLLHDTLEDTKMTKERIAQDFNVEIANLVDGVTKISKLNYYNKAELNMANTRKIITSLTSDVRIIIIKLADRLHNMRTLQYKSEFKQKENALETMEIFAPSAEHLGMYRIKSELEDLSLKYLYPERYKKIESIKSQIENDNHLNLQEMYYNIDNILLSRNIPNEIKVRIKNIYGIYKKLYQGQQVSDIHDLLSLKIIVDDIPSSYLTLGLIHNEYHPINNMFKDYICNPKTNMYQSLHTTVFGPEDRLVQIQIRTFKMDKIDSFGLCAYWDINKGNARDKMQEDLKQNYQFFNSLVEIDRVFTNNQDFVNQVKLELFSDKIYVYTTRGEIIELPKKSTPIDFAYKMGTDIGNTMLYALVNDKAVEPDYKLQNNDRVKIITDIMSYGPREEWSNLAQTTKAKQMIKRFNESKSSNIVI